MKPLDLLQLASLSHRPIAVCLQSTWLPIAYYSCFRLELLAGAVSCIDIKLFGTIIAPVNFTTMKP